MKKQCQEEERKGANEGEEEEEEKARRKLSFCIRNDTLDFVAAGREMGCYCCHEWY